jgi:hypothetical protein
LDLLQFFLNHCRFMRSRVAERTRKSPRELMTGPGHAHWLTCWASDPFSRNALDLGRLIASRTGQLRNLAEKAGGFRPPV